MESVRERVRRAHHGRADVIIGKAGVTREVLREIEARLEKKEVVKVKMLKTALRREEGGRREVARRVASSLGARLMGVRGYTFILYKPRRGKVKRPSGRLLGSWVE
ncbi:YhbY family RNA-binding protein [Aeropyrum camini]|uniref:Predicted RNA-binding protein containing KH domain n=1 Tax=Aeropyrum camini SY1 = JCM 12091 TaxID=1198449 RepID=U3TDT1_9CREN|nr:YhbY family RNA-binding protein [Aeropyrum camini]BAN90175.1 predicted RNA-binding protein containing KH domain [Aeropyrum camini SY1 = JCM 12091]